MRDEIVFGLLLITFAAWVTTHVALCYGIARRSPLRGVLALVVVPLAPAFGVHGAMHKRAVLWMVLAIGYVVLRVASR